jgi:hypothetical protein
MALSAIETLPSKPLSSPSVIRICSPMASDTETSVTWAGLAASEVSCSNADHGLVAATWIATSGGTASYHCCDCRQRIVNDIVNAKLQNVFVDKGLPRVDRRFIDKMKPEQLRDELVELLEERFALMEAFQDLPEVPSITAQYALSHLYFAPGSGLGKQMQRKHGLKIPPKSEYEQGAGLWSVIRAALIAANVKSKPVDE